MLDLSNVAVITMVSNPVRYQSRWDLYKEFANEMLSQGADLYTCEIQHGDRDFQVTSGGVRELQLRTTSEIWHKENALNLLIQKLPPHKTKILWLDADISFIRKDWLTEAAHQLEHYDFIQLFSSAIDLGPQHETLQTYQSFMANYKSGKTVFARGPYNYGYYGHPGFAWGARKDALGGDRPRGGTGSGTGGLFDKGVLGAGDHHMALALVGRVDLSVPGDMSTGYLRELEEWQEKCEQHVRRNVGLVEGTIVHKWHGKKKQRYYKERWDILTENNFDPDLHLQRDWQGLYQLTYSAPLALRDGIRDYFRARNEDSVDVE